MVEGENALSSQLRFLQKKNLLMLKQICVIVEGHIREIVHISKLQAKAVTVAKGKHHYQWRP